MKKQISRLEAVSLFSNCGAGDIGYAKAGFNFEVMAELDQRRLEVCLLNHPNAIGVAGDLRSTWKSVVATYRGKVGEQAPALLSACPPCQGMSSARSGRGLANDADAGSKDERNLLVEVIASVAKDLLPSLVVVENVPAFLTRKVRHPDTGRAVSAASLLISRLATSYSVFPFLTDLFDYGVPQTRKRAFLTFVRNDVSGLAKLIERGRSPYPRIRAFDQKSRQLQHALAKMKLPNLDAKSDETARSRYPLHFVPVWKDRRYEIVAAIPVNSGQSAWTNSSCVRCGEVDVREDEINCPVCNVELPRPLIRDGGGYRFISGFRNSSYRRMHPDRPAATITTASGRIGSDYTIHPNENRVLSPLECALLQTFPKGFRWGNALQDGGVSHVRSMIGEAVPPKFTRIHGRTLVRLLAENFTDLPIRSDDTRATVARRLLGINENGR
jgi:DNA (cytosine-5)-methyltransferase 1